MLPRTHQVSACAPRPTFLTRMRRARGRILRRRQFFRPVLEQLEDRRLLATITVTGTGDSIAVDGLVTLREAITSVNDNASVNEDVVTSEPYETVEADSIHFQISGAGVHTIAPTSALPAITGPVIIDGYTQPGASPNTLVDGGNAVLQIELDGTNAGNGVDGLTIQGGGGTTIRGLVVNRFTRRGFFLSASHDNIIEGNFIGTDASGTADLGNDVGVLLGFRETNSRVGGTLPAARNVISGNSQEGVLGGDVGRFNQIQGNFLGTDITGTLPLGNGRAGVSLSGGFIDGSGMVIGGTTAGARNIISGNNYHGIALGRVGGITIQGNYIGTDVTGTIAVSNAWYGISLFECSNITIGGSTAFAGNLISGNRGYGIYAPWPVGQNPSANTVVLGNLIGTQADGRSALGNGSHGVNGVNCRVGGTASGEANVIAFNGGAGIDAGLNMVITGNSIFANLGHGVAIFGSPNPTLRNAIFANGALGIDLGGNGVTPNDAGDADGPHANGLQNFPVLLEVLSTAVDSTILGSLNSVAQTDFLIQFFANEAADPTGHGEGQTFLGETIVHTNSAGNVSFSANVPVLLTPGQQVTATATRLVDHDANPSTASVPTDTSEFSQATAGTASILELEQTIERDVLSGQELNFRLYVPPGTDARLSALFSNPQIGEILVRVGDLADVNTFAERTVAFIDPSPEFLLPGMPVPYFISVRGVSTAAVPQGHFSLTARAVGLEIDRVSPNHGSNMGQVTTTIVGTGLSSETVFSLVGTGIERAAAGVVQQSDTSFFVTFNLGGLTPGLYDVQATNGSQTAVAEDAFTVNTGDRGLFKAQLVSPFRILLGRESVLVVEYANLGETDIGAPLLFVTSPNSNLTVLPRLASSGNNSGPGSGAATGGGVSFPPYLPPADPPPPAVAVAQILAISHNGPAGILPPGAHERVEIRFQDDGAQSPGFHDSLRFTLHTVVEENNPNFDLAADKDALRPPTVSVEAWDVLFANLLTRFGGAGSTVPVVLYLQALRDAATYLSRYGIYTNDIDRLLAFHFAQADNALPGGSPQVALDAAAPAAGVPLVWGRSFAPTISRRFDSGILGRGWSHSWDMRLSRDPETNEVLIRTPDGTRRFTAQPDGTFVGSHLDPAQLSLLAGVFSLRETDRTVERFDESTGILLDVTDRNGHSITFAYDADRLISLIHSNGDHFDLGYNTAGRLTQLIDHAGRVTTYTYDAGNEHLMSVIGVDGTTMYTYEATSSARAEHALTSVTRPDSTHVFYEYDDQGRLLRVARDGGAEAATFAYGRVGEVSMTDALNHTVSLFFSDTGQVLETRDALGRSARFDYDLAHRLDRVTLPLDTVTLYDFDENGNPTFVVKPDGRSLSFAYDTLFNVPTVIRDERNVPLRYTYDSRGNLTSILHADGSAERFTPDADGTITRSVNRRNQAIDYTYDEQGLIRRKDHADGTFEAFTYDNRGNMLTATDEGGTTTFTYDSADRLTLVTYPNGRFLHYTYDTGGRRSELEDQTGFVIRYIYDAAGRIAELTDGSGSRLVLYTYDATGRLSREDNGNGTFTVYAYDSAGQLVSVLNHLGDGTVSSQFNYTYDALGRRTSVTTLEGLTTFGYDAIGQLTLVTLPDSRIIEYQYDAAGNRTAVIDNGVTTAYHSNDLNQYLRVGSFDRTYDEDGNLIADDAGGPDGTAFTYDDESRLLSWVDGVLSVGYEYDALGNRIAKVEGGVRTEYLIDPLGLTNVVAEYDSAGNLIARYVHGGFGLVSRHDPGGVAAFYDFDAIGSTVAITDASGAIANRYSYLPFGESLAITEAIVNPFEYVGQFGVQRDGNGLDYMRARYYSSGDGRFIHEDPIGVAGGLNLHQYVGNQPTSFVDPSGLVIQVFGVVVAGGAVGALNAAIFLTSGLAVAGGIILLIDTIPDAEPIEDTDIDVEPDGLPWIDLPELPVPRPVPRPSPARIPLPWPNRPVLPGRPGQNGTTKPEGLLPYCNIVDCDDPDFGFPVPDSDETLDDDHTFQVRSFDPNDIVGPTGFGPEQYLPADSSLFYTIRFENLATATAPAQTVVVTQTLDADLDLATFEFLSFGIGASIVTLPTERSSFLLRYDLRPDRNLLLDVGGELNLETGVITWTFTSLDPATFELPDALGDIGFLPPNADPPGGEGFVTYFVRPKSGAPSGTRIDAEASIVFDVNAPIATPAIFHTLDAGLPQSSVDPLPDVTATEDFVVSWSGGDEAGGAGIATYDVYVSIDDRPFEPWLIQTANLTEVYAGEIGRSYAFYSIAHDHVGHVERPPAVPDSMTVVVNRPPMAQDDDYSVGENAPLTVPAAQGVLSNDADEDGEMIQAELVRNATHGTVALHPDGSFEYTPGITPHHEHWDSFEYVATDGMNTSVAATVSITIDTDFPWYNSEKPLDVNDDSDITPVDALQIINELNRYGTYQLPAFRPRPLTGPFFDTSRDGFVSPLDALQVINQLNRGNGEGEAASTNDFAARSSITEAMQTSLLQHSLGDRSRGRGPNRPQSVSRDEPVQQAPPADYESDARALFAAARRESDCGWLQADLESTLHAIVVARKESDSIVEGCADLALVQFATDEADFTKSRLIPSILRARSGASLGTP